MKKLGVFIKKEKGLILSILVLLVGMGVLAYPFVSEFLYWRAANTEIEYFEVAAKQLTDEEREDRLRLAQAYNSTLTSGGGQSLSDPYSDEEKEEGRAVYAQMLEVNEQLGYVTLPKLDSKLPLFAGTTDTVLSRGVGHLEGTTLPVGGESTHAVLTAHRGLPSARLWTDLDQMVIGDIFYVDTLAGTLAYEVDQIDVIEPTDYSQLELVNGADYVTLLTCTPYMINSHRLIVRGRRTAYFPEEALAAEDDGGWRWNSLYVRLATYGGIALLAIFLLLFIPSKRRKNREKA
ncbi:class C sortase [Fundicoccus culcitae]|uniref:Class C sortase n=1 Tax=Fundicoccus culcitae TaxID=2969821 RepID=A0ABY5P8N2_9LACT|nr:class C sortase [Fundicoccus culcitae]UUX35106.1 class C sortase [Fundicoccus culcitae]